MVKGSWLLGTYEFTEVLGIVVAFHGIDTKTRQDMIRNEDKTSKAKKRKEENRKEKEKRNGIIIQLCMPAGALCLLLERSLGTQASRLGPPHRRGGLLLPERRQPHELPTSTRAERVPGCRQAAGVHWLRQPDS